MKTVFFDLGNVLIDVNLPKLLYGLQHISGLSREELKAFLKLKNLRERYEKGKITTLEFYTMIKKRGKKGFSKGEFEKAFSDIFTPNMEVWSIVELLKKEGVKLVLLSNTSECHFEYSKKHYPILKLFDDFVLSYKVGAWKPDTEIFKIALNKASSNLENRFYTDDIPEFIESAKLLGLPGSVFKDATTLHTELVKYKFL